MNKITFPSEFPRFETDRLLLRELTIDDSDAVFRNFSDEAVTQYLMLALTSVEQANEFITAFKDEFEQQAGLTWAVVLKSDMQCIGTVSLEMKTGLRAELGFDLNKAHWGKGLMSEAVKAVMSYAFNELKLTKIEAHTLLLNSGSIQLLKRVGFQVDGILRENCFFKGTYWDEIFFSTLKTA